MIQATNEAHIMKDCLRHVEYISENKKDAISKDVILFEEKQEV